MSTDTIFMDLNTTLNKGATKNMSLCGEISNNNVPIYQSSISNQNKITV